MCVCDFAKSWQHVILDDVFHYLKSNGLVGHHNTVQDPPDHVLQSTVGHDFPVNSGIESQHHGKVITTPKVLMFSAHDRNGIHRQISGYMSYIRSLKITPQKESAFLDDLAHTLNCRRSSLAWKSFAVVESLENLRALDKIISPPQQSKSQPTLGFIFTGQGAQWAGMGHELMRFPTFASSLQDAEEYLMTLGCPWRLSEEVFREKKHSRINSPEISQPVCTVIQVALVDLLSTFGVHATAVVGHSSGEIAAAYTVGALSARAAWKLAYYRGVAASNLCNSSGTVGAMISVGLSEDQISPYMEEFVAQAEFGTCGITVACINSHKNVTLSGDRAQIHALKHRLDQERVFASILSVEIAYHSPHMRFIADAYRAMIQDIEECRTPPQAITMVSSVTGKKVANADLCSPEYWVSNMISPVRFSEAVGDLVARSTQKSRKKLDLSHRDHFHLNMLIEIGPHSTLQGPIRDILTQLRGATNISYTSLLQRHVSASNSLISTFGQIKCLGYPVDIRGIN